MRANVPVPFSGSQEQGTANFQTHHWVNMGGYVCMVCDAKVWHAAARYPCGINPPRVWVEVEEGGA